MNRVLAPVFPLQELTGGEVLLLDSYPLFSVHHDAVPVLELDDAGDAITVAAKGLHSQIAEALGIGEHEEDYPFHGLGVGWHRDGHFWPAEGDGICMHTTIQGLSVIFGARRLYANDAGFHGYRRAENTSMARTKRQAAELQQRGSIGSVAIAISKPTQTVIWRENRQPERDTAHAVVATLPDRFSFGTRWGLA